MKANVPNAIFTTLTTWLVLLGNHVPITPRPHCSATLSRDLNFTVKALPRFDISKCNTSHLSEPNLEGVQCSKWRHELWHTFKPDNVNIIILCHCLTFIIIKYYSLRMLWPLAPSHVQIPSPSAVFAWGQRNAIERKKQRISSLVLTVVAVVSWTLWTIVVQQE